MSRPHKQNRPVNGLVGLDKPINLSSNQALQRVKQLFQAKKAGHTGSLDPLATGLLLICLGQATKISGYLLDADKRYRTTCRLGITTTTGDAEGDVLAERPVGSASVERLETVLRAHTGVVEQRPPMYSAVKHQGQRLYELARAGEEVERDVRRINVHSLEVVARDEATITLDVGCSKGTYIRTLVEDIGMMLGCGAHVTALRRLQVGPFDATGMLSLEELEAKAEAGQLDAALRPFDAALADYPALRLTAESVQHVKSGQPVRVPGAPDCAVLRLYDQRGSFLGTGCMRADGRVGPRRLMI